jgi:cytochrome c biogenesis protein CcmG/thiol:disulfide interchange protein DsbE
VRAPARLIATVAVLAAMAGCGQPPPAGTAAQAPFDPPAKQPKVLAELQDEAGKLIPGGEPVFSERLAALKGHPVVVNKWASWCGPCAAEFPHFAGAAQDYAGEVAFMGVDTLDNAEAAAQFLDRHPVPYPSFSDEDTRIAQSLKAVSAFPATVFFDANGEVAYIKQGGYATREALDQDIDRYALGKTG